MKQRDYHCSFTARVTVKEALNGINRISEWWGNDFEGEIENLNDIFTVHFGPTFTTFKVVEIVPGKKITWHVIDSYKHWLLGNRLEWNDTKLVWEISSKGDLTQIDFTHVGLVPGLECYETCVKGWNFYIKESLFLLLTVGKGLPEAKTIRE